MTQSQLKPLTFIGNEDKKLMLHLLLQIIGKIRMANMPRKNHWWYITEYIDAKGFTTGSIPYNNGFDVFKMTLNVVNHQMEIETSNGNFVTFPLNDALSVSKFYSQLTSILDDLSIPREILAKPFELNINREFGKINDLKSYDKDYVTALWKTFIWVDSVFKEFSGRSYSKTCPVHLYWHSMDLTVTRFSGKKAPPMPAEARLSDKDAYSHEVISFGFWPGDENTPKPAFYSYTFPSPKDLEKESIMPKSAEWTMANGSPMAILKYSDLINEENPREALLDFMETTYQAGSRLANWDVEFYKVPDLEDL